MENSENKYSFDTAILKAVIERGSDFLAGHVRHPADQELRLLSAVAPERAAFRKVLDHGHGRNQTVQGKAVRMPFRALRAEYRRVRIERFRG